jgi:uncharacterized protein
MTWLTLAFAAFAAGAINSIAGGGTLLTFPALTMFVTADVANATSTLSLLPGSVSGAWGYRKELKEVVGWITILILPSLVGGILGALLVVWFPQAFRSLIPWLILGATILFAVQPAVSRWLKTSSPNDGHSKSSKQSLFGVIIFQFFVALYGGYFGAGIGILMLASLGVMAIGSIHQMNAVKTVLASTINLASVVVFIGSQNLIHWPFAAVMAIAAILGGYTGAKIARKIPAHIVRWIVIVIGLVLSGFYFYGLYSARSES